MATSIFLTRRLLPKLGVKRMLLLGLAAMGVGQAWLSQITAGGSYEVNVLAGVMLTAFGLGIAFPTVSIAVTAGIPARQQGVAGGLFVTAQQVGAAAGLAVLATVADARTRAAHGSLVAGYQLSFLVAVGFIAAAAAIVLIQLRRTTSAPRLAVPASPVGTPAASAAVPAQPATVGFTKPEPADRCPLTRCGLGVTCTLPAMTLPECVPAAAIKALHSGPCHRGRTPSASRTRPPSSASLEPSPSTCTTSGRPLCNVPGQLRRAVRADVRPTMAATRRR